jgi:hypothetical protein
MEKYLKISHIVTLSREEKDSLKVKKMRKYVTRLKHLKKVIGDFDFHLFALHTYFLL